MGVAIEYGLLTAIDLCFERFIIESGLFSVDGGAQGGIGREQLDLLQAGDRLLTSRLFRNILVLPNGLYHLKPHGVDRVQRAHRLLKNHRDLATPVALQLSFAEGAQVNRRPSPPVEPNFAIHHLAWRVRHQPHHRQRGHRLARPRFPHNA